MICPKCGAPAEHSAPDGDFRYRPPINKTDRLQQQIKTLRDMLTALRKMNEENGHADNTPEQELIDKALAVTEETQP